MKRHVRKPISDRVVGEPVIRPRTPKWPRLVLVLGLAVAFACLLSAVALGGSAVAEDRSVSLELDTAALDRFVDAHLERTGIPGMEVAIIKDEEVVYVAGYGQSSTGKPVTAQTRMRIASLSKSFTSLAVMQLVEAGEVDLDAAVKDYLPGFEMDDPRADEITVRHLLNQTSGITGGSAPEANLPADSLQEAVGNLRTAELATDPGEEFSYNNANYWTAARLVEVVSGESFTDYLDERVFDPLGMDDTVAVESGDQSVAELSDGHSRAYTKALVRPALDQFVSGSGGVVSTAEDLSKWLIVQNNEGRTENGTRILSAASIQEMHTPPDGDSNYGMGWRNDKPEGEPRRISHGGAVFTFASYQGLFPGSGYGIAVLSNSGPYPLYEDTYPVVQSVNEIVEGETPQPAPPVALIGDSVLAILTLGTLALGVLCVIRARRWADRRSDKRRWITVLRMLPHQIPFLIIVALLAYVYALGYDLAVAVSFAFFWPAFTMLLIVAATSGVAVSTARAIQLRKRGFKTPFFEVRERG